MCQQPCSFSHSHTIRAQGQDQRTGKPTDCRLRDPAHSASRPFSDNAASWSQPRPSPCAPPLREASAAAHKGTCSPVGSATAAASSRGPAASCKDPAPDTRPPFLHSRLGARGRTRRCTRLAPSTPGVRRAPARIAPLDHALRPLSEPSAATAAAQSPLPASPLPRSALGGASARGSFPGPRVLRARASSWSQRPLPGPRGVCLSVFNAIRVRGTSSEAHASLRFSHAVTRS